MARHTRFGEVTSLLTDSDDIYVIMCNGDELTQDFDAAVRPELPEVGP
jgi:hypothetical protein